MYVKDNEIVFFDSFGVEHLPKEIKKFIEKYFNSIIKKIKLSSNTLTIYVAAFYYIDKILIVLSETSGGVSIISFFLLELL